MKFLALTPHPQTAIKLRMICTQGYGSVPTFVFTHVETLSAALAELPSFQPRFVLLDMTLPHVEQALPALAQTGAIVVALAHSMKDQHDGEDVMDFAARIGCDLFLSLHALFNDPAILYRQLGWITAKRKHQNAQSN